VFILTEEQEVNSLEGKLTNTLENVNFANVVGVLPGKRTDEYLLFSAHYDHLGKIEPVDGDAIANGADDDASGVTGIILLARYFAAGEMPERTLVFVAFTAEEMGTLGSRQFSKVIKPEQIVAGINLEMIGKPSKFGKGQVFLTGFDRSDLGSLMQKRMENTEFALHPDPYPTMNLFFRSDNAPFARLGVPAHTVSAAQIDQDKFYHTVDDEVETLDMEHLTAAIKAVATGVAGLVNGEDTPTRLKTSP
jgi:Zn-dependent M28 family amino/carboxypeptidase